MIERIAELTIPPAWRDVWVCMDPHGHLQATGIDAASRKQYRYHDRWREHRDRLKFDSMTAFGVALPRLRRGVGRDLSLPGRNRLPVAELTRERVLACSVRLLDVGFFRIGSEDYAEQNESYGLTTMLRRHVSVQENSLVFDFPAKSGQRRVQEIADGDALRVVSALKRRRSGEQLLAYRSHGGWVEPAAEDVNAYIKQQSGGPFTAKDFRTWNATVLAAVALAAAESSATARARDRIVRAAIATVAGYLGNTPAVCRASYVDPRVIDRYREGVTIAGALALGRRAGGPDLADTRVRGRIESAVLELLDESAGARSSPARAA